MNFGIGLELVQARGDKRDPVSRPLRRGWSESQPGRGGPMPPATPADPHDENVEGRRSILRP